MTRTRTFPDKDRGGAARQKSEVLLRIASALVLAALALGAAIASPWSFLVLVILSAGIVAWEWGRLVRGEGIDRIAILEAVAVAAVAILLTLRRGDLAALALAVAAVAVALLSRSSDRSAWSLGGLFYAALPAAALVFLRSDPSLGAIAVLYLFAVAWTTDTASYAAGRLIGGPKLAPRISPQKTWSGFIIGALTPALVGYAFALWLKDTSAWRLALVSIALALACQLGDLLESAVKRHFGTKDMSQLIPGHGGLLDRIDGLLIAAILASLIALRDPGNPGRGLLIW
ncbi:MAG: phosphatidate cytidylyltransferase [Actinomycetota bacterium]